MSVRLEQVDHHALVFHPKDLPDGYGVCATCGKRMSAEAWVMERCPGTRKEPR